MKILKSLIGAVYTVVLKAQQQEAMQWLQTNALRHLLG
jgi:hypothetical protein